MTAEAKSDDFGVKTAPDTVRLERMLPGPIERVWTYLTDATKRGEWLAAGEMQPRVGGKVQLTFRHSELSPVKAEVPEQYRRYEGSGFEVTVTRWEPPRVLGITWPGMKGESSEVLFELTPSGSEVRLVVIHQRLAEVSDQISVASGWHTHLGVLRDVLAGRVPENFWVAHGRIRPQYEQRFGSA